jgi:hypothetical protein
MTRKERNRDEEEFLDGIDEVIEEQRGVLDRLVD